MLNKSRLTSVFLLFIGVVVGGLVFSQINPQTQPVAISAPAAPAKSGTSADRTISSLRDLSNAYVEIAEAVNPAVITVFTEKVYERNSDDSQFGPFSDFFEEFFGQNPHGDSRRRDTPQEEHRQQGLGSGVIVSSDGYILTNNHVIEEADTIKVRLMDDRTVPARVIGADAKTDIAVLKIDEKNLPTVKLGNSDDLRVGEIVLAVGSPMSANLAHTVTNGIVSAKSRSNVGLADYEDFIQTDAAINPGNSGGALVNLDGELVGINTAIATRTGGFQGIGFAVPVNMARSIMESLIKHGEVIRGWLGVSIQDVDENLAKAMKLSHTAGVLINQVVEDSPAEKAGLKTGDVIVALNNENMKNVAQLRNRVAATAPDTRINLTILREDKKQDIGVTLGRLDAAGTPVAAKEKLSELLGFTVAQPTKDLTKQYDLEENAAGALVTEIKSGSEAYRNGLRKGDLILSLNRREVNSMNDFRTLADPLKKGDSMLLLIERGSNGSLFIAFTL